MKKYFVRYDADFSNCYSLCYTSDGSEPTGWDRITRNEAEQLARAEARRRKDNPSFAGYADAYVYPLDVPTRYKFNDHIDTSSMINDAMAHIGGLYLSGHVIEIAAKEAI